MNPRDPIPFTMFGISTAEMALTEGRPAWVRIDDELGHMIDTFRLFDQDLRFYVESPGVEYPPVLRVEKS